mgnify:CR=1 FL=1
MGLRGAGLTPGSWRCHVPQPFMTLQLSTSNRAKAELLLRKVSFIVGKFFEQISLKLSRFIEAHFLSNELNVYLW